MKIGLIFSSYPSSISLLLEYEKIYLKGSCPLEPYQTKPGWNIGKFQHGNAFNLLTYDYPQCKIHL